MTGRSSAVRPRAVDDVVEGAPAPGAPERGASGAGAAREGRRPAPRLLFWLAALPLAIGGVVDLPRERAAGAMSALGALTLAEAAVAALVLVACGRYPRRLLERLAPFAAFLVWAAASVLWATPDVHGTQNIAAYLLLGFATAASGAVAARDPARAARALDWAAGVLDLVGLTLVAMSLARQGWSVTMHEATWLVHPRAVALTGLAAMAWHLARWHHGRRADLLPAALWAAAIFVSLSRMATLTAVVLVAAAGLLHRRRRARVPAGVEHRVRLAVAGAGVAALLAAVFLVGPFRARVFRTTAGAAGPPPSALAPGSTDLQDSDRPLFWAHVASSALKAPIVGQGIGSSQSVMNDRWPEVSHPHNDYLRVWHDLGLIGLAALVTSFATWGRALASDWRRAASADYADEGEEAAAPLAFAGLLALVALALPMVTDNAIVYPFVVGPVGVLVGAGLGARTRRAGGGRREAGTPMPSVAPANPLDARWAWEPRYPIRRRRRR